MRSSFGGALTYNLLLYHSHDAFWNNVGNEKQREMAKELAIWLHGAKSI
jgi:hypothetical protein